MRHHLETEKASHRVGECICHSSNRWLMCRICKELQSTKKETDKWIENLAKDLNGHFTKEDIQIAETHKGRWFTSLGTWKIKPQRNTTRCTPEGLELKRPTIPSVGRNEEQLLTLI